MDGAELDQFGGAHAEADENEVPVSSRGEPKGPPSACLFVASLAPETAEAALHTYFVQYGPILKNVEDAEACLAVPQSHLLEGRRLRVEKAKVNRTLFVAKLHRLMRQWELRTIAEEYGPVENVTIIKNHQTNHSKGCGFIKYVFREDAMDALAGFKQRNKKWIVEWATSANDPDMLGVDKNSIFVGGLNAALVTKEMLEERFAVYGKIESLTLINPLKPTSSTSATTATPISTDSAQSDAAAQLETATTTTEAAPAEATAAPATTTETAAPTTESVSPAPATAGPNDKQEQVSADEGSLAGDAPSNTLDGAAYSKGMLSKRTAFAFLRFTEASASASAIENENSSMWLDRRIRVQYCETPEMKYRKRFNKYITILSRYGQAPYFYAPAAAGAGYMPATYADPSAAGAFAMEMPAQGGPAVLTPGQAPSAAFPAPGAYYGWYFNPEVNAWYYMPAAQSADAETEYTVSPSELDGYYGTSPYPYAASEVKPVAAVQNGEYAIADGYYADAYSPYYQVSVPGAHVPSYHKPARNNYKSGRADAAPRAHQRGSGSGPNHTRRNNHIHHNAGSSDAASTSQNGYKNSSRQYPQGHRFRQVDGTEPHQVDTAPAPVEPKQETVYTPAPGSYAAIAAKARTAPTDNKQQASQPRGTKGTATVSSK